MSKNTVGGVDIPQPWAKKIKNDSLVDIVFIVLVLYVCMFNCWVLSLFKVQSNCFLFPPENAKTIFCSTPFSIWVQWPSGFTRKLAALGFRVDSGDLRISQLLKKSWFSFPAHWHCTWAFKSHFLLFKQKYVSGERWVRLCCWWHSLFSLVLFHFINLLFLF